MPFMLAVRQLMMLKHKELDYYGNPTLANMVLLIRLFANLH